MTATLTTDDVRDALDYLGATLTLEHVWDATRRCGDPLGVVRAAQAAKEGEEYVYPYTTGKVNLSYAYQVGVMQGWFDDWKVPDYSWEYEDRWEYFDGVRFGQLCRREFLGVLDDQPPPERPKDRQAWEAKTWVPPHYQGGPAD